MDKRRNISKQLKGKLASRPLRNAAVPGLVVSGLAAASLGGVPTADATCFSAFGLFGGGECTSTFGSVALVLGTGTADASGFLTAAIGTGTDVTAFSGGLGTLAYAGGTGTEAGTAGILNLAASQGTNVAAFAGLRPLDFINIAVNIGNADDPLTLDSEGNPVGASSWVQASDGAFNLAGNLFGNATAGGSGRPMIVWSGGDDQSLGFGTVAANVFGNRNEVQAIGTLVNATNWGNAFTFPNGSDNIVTAGFIGSPTSLSWAFSYQGIFTEVCDSNCDNFVNAAGPGAIAGAIGVVKRDVDQPSFGVSIATQFNDTGTAVSSTGNNTNVLAASGTQRNRVRLNSTGSNTNVLAASGTQGNRVRSSFDATADRPVLKSVKKFSDKLAASNKKFKDAVKSATDRRAAGADAGVGTTGNSDK